MNDVNIYTTRKGQQGEDVLFINGLQSICPFTPALIVGGHLGQTQIIRLPCSTVCPLSNTNFTGGKYNLSCTGKYEELILDSVETIPDNNSSKLIKL